MDQLVNAAFAAGRVPVAGGAPAPDSFALRRLQAERLTDAAPAGAPPDALGRAPHGHDRRGPKRRADRRLPRPEPAALVGARVRHLHPAGPRHARGHGPGGPPAAGRRGHGRGRARLRAVSGVLGPRAGDRRRPRVRDDRAGLARPPLGGGSRTGGQRGVTAGASEGGADTRARGDAQLLFRGRPRLLLPDRSHCASTARHPRRTPPSRSIPPGPAGPASAAVPCSAPRPAARTPARRAPETAPSPSGSGA